MVETHICRLCFTVADIRFDKIDEMKAGMLEVLLFGMDLNLIENPTICQNCKAIIERSFLFKSVCIHTEKVVAAFAVNKEDPTFEFIDMFPESGGTKMIFEKDVRCRFCMNRLEKNVCVSVGILMEETLYREMLSVFMPEMDFNMVENSVICVECKSHLEQYLTFVRKYLDVENKIHTFCQGKGYRGQIKMSHVLRNGDLNKFNNYSGTHIDKTKSTASQELDNAYYCELTKIEEVLDIKHEDVDLNESLEHPQSKTISSETILFDHKKSRGETTQSKSVDCHLYNQSQDKKVQDVIKRKCTNTKCKGSVNRHRLTHKNTSEVEIYKCELCSYKTKYKRLLKQHRLTHRDVSDVKMYKCSHCPYKTKWKHHLSRHARRHKDASELEMYKCPECDSQFTCKQYVQRHMLTHKDSPKQEKHKCTMCDFETKQKYYIKRHMLIHRDKLEEEMHKCELCIYRTKYKHLLEDHRLTHRDASEVKMYKCSHCLYETKWKSHLNRHARRHKEASELEMYACANCNSQFTCKQYIQRHMLIHKDSHKQEKHKCPMCDFETKQKYYVKRHMLIHKDASEVEMHKCTL